VCWGRRRSLTKFTFFLCIKHAKMQEKTFFFVVAMKYADGYVNYTCFSAKSSSLFPHSKDSKDSRKARMSDERKRKTLFCHLPSLLCEHICTQHRQKYYMRVLILLKNLTFFRSLNFSIPFSFCRCRGERKIRGRAAAVVSI
jgi:hypothetical protein